MPRLSGVDKGRRRKRKRTSTPEQNKNINASDDGMTFEDFTDLAELSPRSSTSSTVTPLVKDKNACSLEKQPNTPSFGSTRGASSHNTITSIMKNHLPQVSTAKRPRLDHAASDSTCNQPGRKSVHFDTAIIENKIEARPIKKSLTMEKQIPSCTKRSLEELMAYIQPKYPHINVSTLICNQEQGQVANISLYELSEKFFGQNLDHSLKQQVVAEVMCAILELFQVHPGWILTHTSQEVKQVSITSFINQIRINISTSQKGIDCHYCPDSYFVEVHENEIPMLFVEVLALLLLGIELDDDNINGSFKYVFLKQSISCNRALGQQTFWGKVMTAVEHGDLDEAVKLIRGFSNGKESWKNIFCASREEEQVDHNSEVPSNQKLLPQPKSLFENIDLDDNRRSIIESELKMAREKVAYYESMLDSSPKVIASTVQPEVKKVSETVQKKETSQTVKSDNGSTNDKEEKINNESNDISNTCVYSEETNFLEVAQGEDRNAEFGNSLKSLERQKFVQTTSSDRNTTDKIVGNKEHDKSDYHNKISGESVYSEGSNVFETVFVENIVDSIPSDEIDETIHVEKMEGKGTSKKNSNRKNASSEGGTILHSATSNEVDNSNSIEKDIDRTKKNSQSSKVSFSIPKKKEIVHVDGEMTNTLTDINEEPIMTSIIEPNVEQIESMEEVSVNPSFPYGHSRNPVREMRVGSRIDVLDKYGVWSSATVVERKKKHVKIQYDGWHSKWNDKLHLNSKRIAPIYTHSARIKCLAGLHFMGKKNSVKRKEYLLWSTSTSTSNGVDSESTENKIYNPSDIWPCILHVRMPSAKKKSTKVLSKDKNVFVEPYLPSLLPNYFQKLMEFGGFWISSESVQLFPYSPTQHTSFIEDHAESNFRTNFKKAFVAAVEDKTTPGYLKTQNLYKKGSLVNYRYQSSMERLVDFSDWHDEDAFRNENNDTSVKKQAEK